MRPIYYLTLSIITMILIIIISISLKYIGIRSGILITSMVLISGAIIYFLLTKIPKNNFTHEGIDEAIKKKKG